MNSTRILVSIVSVTVSLTLISCVGQTSTTQPSLPTQPWTEPAPTNTAIPRCPTYGQPQQILSIANSQGRNAEPALLTGDFNSDGRDDVLVAWSVFREYASFKLEVLLNDGEGSLYPGTSELILGEIPETEFLAAEPMIVKDLNGDGRNDVFLAIAGLDTDPFPGHQNLLLLSNADGRLVDATANLPQLNDFPHSVASADIDNDGDIDLYVGNIWAQEMINPQLLLNDGNGVFTAANHLLPPQLALQQNGYTASEFVDVNNDSFPDLILGDAGDDIANEYSLPDSVVLLNDGRGRFTLLTGAIPSKLSPRWLALDIVAADLDSDNYQDLIITYTGDDSYVGRFFQVLVNNQDGTFTDETEPRLHSLSSDSPGDIYRLDLIDIDNDDDLDLIARNWNDHSPTPFLFANRGDGFFSQEMLDASLDSIFYTILDIDNDGGNDFVYAYYGSSTPVYLMREQGCE